MAKVIYKYPLKLRPGVQTLKTPKNSQLLHIGEQRGEYFVWAMHDIAEEDCELRFWVSAMTGIEIQEEFLDRVGEAGDLRYSTRYAKVQTLVTDSFVVHIWIGYPNDRR